MPAVMGTNYRPSTRAAAPCSCWGAVMGGGGSCKRAEQRAYHGVVIPAFANAVFSRVLAATWSLVANSGYAAPFASLLRSPAKEIIWVTEPMVLPIPAVLTNRLGHHLSAQRGAHDALHVFYGKIVAGQ
jgi:hypothetical protein